MGLYQHGRFKHLTADPTLRGQISANPYLVPHMAGTGSARGRSAGNKAGKQMHPSERQKARNTPKKGAHSRDHDGESSSGNPRATKAAKTVDASGADFIAATRAACGMHGPAAGSMPVLSPCTRQSRS